jgi:hypothetical protein
MHAVVRAGSPSRTGATTLPAKAGEKEGSASRCQRQEREREREMRQRQAGASSKAPHANGTYPLHVTPSRNHANQAPSSRFEPWPLSQPHNPLATKADRETGDP